MAEPFPYPEALCGPNWLYHSSGLWPCSWVPLQPCHFMTFALQTYQTLGHQMHPYLPEIVLFSPSPENSYTSFKAPQSLIGRSRNQIQLGL